MSRPAPSLRRIGKSLIHLMLVLLLLAAISLAAVRLMELAYRYTPVESVRDGVLEQLREWTTADGKAFHPQQAKNVLTTYADALADYANAREELVRPDLSRALALYLALPEGLLLDRIAIDGDGRAFYLYCSLSPSEEDAPDASGSQPEESSPPAGQDGEDGEDGEQARRAEADRLAEAFTSALLSQRVFQQVDRAEAPPSSDFVLVVSWEEESGTVLA